MSGELASTVGIGPAPGFLSSASTRLTGPGHNSVLVADDRYLTAFHAWNGQRTARQMYIGTVTFEE
ncbi:hypothetical protein ACO2Q7_07965 [Rathayibacter sp. KR2-224]|uniref:hypothetical protein n=1 Tax=Rathayibacter sp. KR2-224 TaxID=3400913 RepID=UPI003C111DFE